jgi:hypothetical protein
MNERDIRQHAALLGDAKSFAQLSPRYVFVMASSH